MFVISTLRRSGDHDTVVRVSGTYQERLQHNNLLQPRSSDDSHTRDTF